MVLELLNTGDIKFLIRDLATTYVRRLVGRCDIVSVVGDEGAINIEYSTPLEPKPKPKPAARPRRKHAGNAQLLAQLRDAGCEVDSDDSGGDLESWLTEILDAAGVAGNDDLHTEIIEAEGTWGRGARRGSQCSQQHSAGIWPAVIF